MRPTRVHLTRQLHTIEGARHLNVGEEQRHILRLLRIARASSSFSASKPGSLAPLRHPKQGSESDRHPRRRESNREDVRRCLPPTANACVKTGFTRHIFLFIRKMTEQSGESEGANCRGVASQVCFGRDKRISTPFASAVSVAASLQVFGGPAIRDENARSGPR